MNYNTDEVEEPHQDKTILLEEVLYAEFIFRMFHSLLCSRRIYQGGQKPLLTFH